MPGKRKKSKLSASNCTATNSKIKNRNHHSCFTPEKELLQPGKKISRCTWGVCIFLSNDAISICRLWPVVWWSFSKKMHCLNRMACCLSWEAFLKKHVQFSIIFSLISSAQHYCQCWQLAIPPCRMLLYIFKGGKTCSNHALDFNHLQSALRGKLHWTGVLLSISSANN